MKDTKRMFVTGIKIRKLHEGSSWKGFRSYVKRFKESSKASVFVGYCKVLKGALLEVIDRTCGWTKYTARQRETLRWNYHVSNSYSFILGWF